MPIYEYRCASCGYQNEYLQKVSEPLRTQCPECGKATFNKLISAAGFQLKGNGWYVTDFRNNGAKPKEAAKTGAAKDKPDAPEAKKEEKKDDKPEPACGTGACPACT